MFGHSGPEKAAAFCNSLPNLENFERYVQVFFLGDRESWERIRRSGFRGAMNVRVDVVYRWLLVMKEV